MRSLPFERSVDQCRVGRDGPFSTRKRLIRPANGSATVLKTKAAVAAPSTSTGDPFFAGDGHALDDQVEQRVRAEVLRRHAARDRKDVAARDRGLQRGRDLARRRAPARRGNAPSVPRRSPRPRRGASRGTPRPGRPSRPGSAPGSPSFSPSGLAYAHMWSTSTIPVSSCSKPIGMCTATHFVESWLRSASSVRKKSARSRSSMFTKTTRARPSSSASLQAREVPTSTPMTPPTPYERPLHHSRAQRSSPWKPGRRARRRD